MNKINGGCFLVARKIIESDIWTSKPCWWLKVWIYILKQVNHADNKLFKRGQNYFSLKQIYYNCYLSREGLNVKSADNPLRWLRREEQITTQKTTRGIIITVLNYNQYQKLSNYKYDTKNDTENGIDTTQIRHRYDTINNNDKKDKNDKNKRYAEASSAPIAKQKDPLLGTVIKYILDKRKEITKQKYDFTKKNAGQLARKVRIFSHAEVMACFDMFINDRIDDPGRFWRKGYTIDSFCGNQCFSLCQEAPGHKERTMWHESNTFGMRIFPKEKEGGDRS